MEQQDGKHGNKKKRRVSFWQYHVVMAKFWDPQRSKNTRKLCLQSRERYWSEIIEQ